MKLRGQKGSGNGLDREKKTGKTKDVHLDMGKEDMQEVGATEDEVFD